MKHVTSVLGILLVSLFAGAPMLVQPIQAQNPRIAHSVTHARHDAPMLGRDCWFMLLNNYGAGGAGKYFALYVTSPKKTTVYVQRTGGTEDSLSIQPFTSAVFNIPLAWEMQSSGIADNFGIHVWSNDADISCYVMSHNPYTSDGMYVIPSIGWGTEYVVAGYASLFEGFGSYVYDQPSEFGIVANQDNTHVSITPSADIRIESSITGCCSCLLMAKGLTYNITLKAGQAVQYKTTCTQDCDNFDVTGTVITSNNPIGVEAGSSCPNIPCDFPYCDHVFDYIPPTRTWGNTYYSVPFYQPPGMPPSHSASTFLVIATKPGQVITRYDTATNAATTYFIAHHQYEIYWSNNIDQASRWTSDTAFLLVQYINSTSYPDNYNGQGDPAEVVLSPVENFQKTVTFITPMSIGNQSPYTNYVNIIAKSGDKHVMLDSKSVTNQFKIKIDNIYTGYRVPNVKPGGHTLTSDSGAWAYIYGYGWDESYAWPGPMGTATVVSKDTTPPIASAYGPCFGAHVDLIDVDGDSGNIGFYYVRLDTVRNMSYSLDPRWQEGAPRNTSYYQMSVIDQAQPATLVVSAFDMAGNRTTITSTYTPQTVRIGPPLQNFGLGNSSTCVYRYDTLVNTGEVPLAFNTLNLALNNQGFSIDSAVMTPLSVGEARLIKLCFKSVSGARVFDTIVFGDSCAFEEAALTGSGGQADFYVTGHDLGTQSLGASTEFCVLLINSSTTQAITIDSIWVNDPVHFVLDATGNHALPLTIPPGGRDTVCLTFRTTSPPDTAGQYKAILYAFSKELVGFGDTGDRSSTLTALLLNAAGVPAPDDKASTPALVLSDDHKLRVTLPADWQGTTRLELEDLNGIKVLEATIDRNAIDVSTLPTGAYLYRLTDGQKVLTGKMVIER